LFTLVQVVRLFKISRDPSLHSRHIWQPGTLIGKK